MIMYAYFFHIGVHTIIRKCYVDDLKVAGDLAVRDKVTMLAGIWQFWMSLQCS